MCDFSKLSEPFAAKEIEWRIGRSGKKQNGDIWAVAVPYITNRAIMQRLDDVAGPAYWKNEFRDWQSAGVLCGISIFTGDEWVTKWDGAGNTEIEPVKGGLSHSMKRAAVQWGIGRYLYDLDEAFVETSLSKNNQCQIYAKSRDGVFYWREPQLPAWALPTGKPRQIEPGEIFLATEEQMQRLQQLRSEWPGGMTDQQFRIGLVTHKVANPDELTHDEAARVIDAMAGKLKELRMKGAA